MNGKSVAVNSEFAQQAIFLSQQLDASERHVAEVLHSVRSQNPNIDDINCLESTVLEFHERRRHLADTLRYLFEICDASWDDGMPTVFGRIESFVSNELVAPDLLPGAREVPLAFRIFKQLETMGIQIQRADAARKSAKSNSIIPQPGQGTCSPMFLWSPSDQ